MLVSSGTISDRYGDGLQYIADYSYSQYIKELYGVQFRKSQDGIKLLLLLHALDSWDNRQGATNDLSTLQMLRIMDNIAKLRQTNPLGSAYAGNISSAGGQNPAPLFIRDSNSMDLSLSNNQLEATVKRSATIGNLLQERPDGLYVGGTSGTQRILPITGDQFASATRYDNSDLVGMNVQIWHRGLGFLVLEDGEYELLAGGGFNILIPGFDAKAGKNYFYLFISTP